MPTKIQLPTAPRMSRQVTSKAAAIPIDQTHARDLAGGSDPIVGELRIACLDEEPQAQWDEHEHDEGAGDVPGIDRRTLHDQRHHDGARAPDRPRLSMSASSCAVSLDRC